MDRLTILQIGTAGTAVRKGSGIGGAEKVISYLDGEFLRQGHNSIVAAPGDSEVYGLLVPTLDSSFKGKEDSKAYEDHYKKVVEFVLGNNVDIIHDNPGRGFVNSTAFLENASQINAPILITNHGSQLPGLSEDHERLKLLMKKYPIHVNAISQSQKRSLEKDAKIEIADVIYHGTSIEIFGFEKKPEDYYFSLARICREKGQAIALSVAEKNRKGLIIAGSVEDRVYFDNEINPKLDARRKYIGPVNDRQKAGLYKGAEAFLMPIIWPEPFGLVMIEALASGTPVIAFNFGAASEIVEDGKTGFIINPVFSRGKLDLEEMTKQMAEKARDIGSISREYCKTRCSERFTIEQEARNYLNLYRRLISKNQ